MRLLLTGASGFFGSNLIDLLQSPTDGRASAGPAASSPAELELHIIQRSGGAGPQQAIDTGVGAPQIHRADLFDHEAVAALCQRIQPTHLCHMAWLGPETTDRYRSPENQRWVAASKGLFDAFASAGGQRLVHLGSCIEYGNGASGTRVETQPLDPDTAYGEAKAELSTHVMSLGDQLSTAIARPFFCYGPHEQPDRLVPSLVLGLAKGETIDLTEGRQRRDYLDARDVAAALLALLVSDATGPFNIGSGVGVEVRSIAERLGRISGRPELLNFGARPDGADSAAEIVADIGRITAATAWRPSISLDQGLSHAWAWWRSNTAGGQDRNSGQQVERAEAGPGGNA